MQSTTQGWGTYGDHFGILESSSSYSLLCALVKETSIQDIYNNLLPQEQFGFRDKLSCTSAVSIFYEAIHNRLESGKNTFVCFLDLRKAFDRINRELLFKKLVTLGVP